MHTWVHNYYTSCQKSHVIGPLTTGPLTTSPPVCTKWTWIVTYFCAGNGNRSHKCLVQLIVFCQQAFCIAIVCLSLTATKLWGTLLHKVATGIKLLARIRNTKSLCFRALNSLKEELNGILSVRTFRTNLRSEKDKLKTRRYDFALRKTPFKIAGFVLGV